MTLKAFIKANREEIDAAIVRALRHTPKEASCQCPLSGARDHECGSYPNLDDEDRRRWILNDEGLYTWARSEGVRL